MSFWDWLFYSLSTVPLRSLQDVACINCSFLFIAVWYFVVWWIYFSSFNHSPIVGCFGFQFFVITNKVGMNNHVQVSCGQITDFSMALMSRIVIAGPYVKCVFNFWTVKLFSGVALQFTLLPAMYKRSSVSTSSPAFGVISVVCLSNSVSMCDTSCGLNLHSPNNQWYYTSFHVLICLQ